MHKILVVDDEPKIVDIITDFLTIKGFKIEKAYGGREALDTIKGDPSIDLIILDKKMPGIDGLAVIKELKDLGKKIPVIVITGSIGAIQPGHTEKIDCESLLLKPIRLSALLKKVNKVLSQKKTAKSSK